ncbi:hypothetical protein [Spirilliplanes yamanashiensis]|uniref:Uncharacterized protein n=1 Tax=Spirilliplanes yamanashiensis TaxID=42233 RepID=A0A8J3Y4D2_9ACTN|nr:hypothetical protein [Spirilliplanes yamanashiensis]MDP9820016.1 hypothetical protein [Spirilliplanes yamanashiensis]GIJ01165.1 hypothetical protein Sya03_05170 [Spirilliplanes yamanashiensis]
MSDLSDMERDARQVAQALASLSAYVRLHGDSGDAALRMLAAEGSDAAERVLSYLRELRGSGDGEATAYPQRLGPWRDWCPPRGHVLDSVAAPQPAVAKRLRGDPGE